MSDPITRVDCLINGYIERSLTADEANELEQILNENSEMSERFVEAVLGHFLLRQQGKYNLQNSAVSKQPQRIVSPNMFTPPKVPSLDELIAERNSSSMSIKNEWRLKRREVWWKLSL